MRLSRNLTQAELAERLHQSPSSITMYETGRRAPDYETLEALADVFNVPLSSLVDDSPPFDPVPHTIEARIVSFGMDRLPQAEREKILFALQTMYANNPDLFKKGDADDS